MVVEAIGNDDSKEGGWENEASMYEVELVEVVETLESRYFDLKYYLST